MQKFDNYVYLSICEITYKIYKSSHFMTYINYCKTLKVSIETNSIDNKETAQIIKVFNYLSKIYGFSDIESLDYLKKFLKLDTLIEFQKCVEAEKNASGNLFD